MYHKLVDEMMNSSLDKLLDKLEDAGFKATEYDPDILTDQDVEEAWEHYQTDSPEAAVDYLETMFGFLFEEL